MAKNNLSFEDFLKYCDAGGLEWFEKDKIYKLQKAESVFYVFLTHMCFGYFYKNHNSDGYTTNRVKTYISAKHAFNAIIDYF